MKDIERLTRHVLLLAFLLIVSACDEGSPTGTAPEMEWEADPPSVDAPARVNASSWASPGALAPVVAFDALQGELPEGIAIDRFGRLYVSLTPLGEIRRIDSDGSTTTVVRFRLRPGDFGVIGLNVDRQDNLYAAVSSSDPDVNGVWKLPLDGPKEHLAGTEQIGFPNDITFDSRGAVYISDSSGGAIWRVPSEGAADLWIADATLEGTGGVIPGFVIGANGIAFVSGKSPPALRNSSTESVGGVFAANTDKGLVAYVPLKPDGQAGTPHVIASAPDRLTGLDGIRLDATGHIYGAVNVQNKVVEISPDGRSIQTLADTGLDFPASLAFGKKRDRHTLFITNFAGLTAQVTPEEAEPGVVKLAVGPPGHGRH